MTQPRYLVRGAVTLGFALLFFIATVPSVRTYPQFLQQAKAKGYPAKDCRYCHTTAEGGDTFNARGKWLTAEKDKRGASAVDVDWLKDYKAGRTTRKSSKKATER